MNKRPFILILALLILSSFVSAEFIIQTKGSENKFAIQYEDTIDACQCTERFARFIITNKGQTSIRFSGYTNDTRAVIYPEQAFINPDQAIAVSSPIRIGCDESEDFTITYVFQVGSEKKTVPLKVSVEGCNNLAVKPIQMEGIIDPCNEANITFTIYNTEYYAETYYIAAEGFPGTAILPGPITIPAYNNVTVRLSFIPDCSIYGHIEQDLIIKTEYSKLGLSFPLKINITDKYGFSIDIDDRFTVCNGIESQRSIIINNFADLNNSYSLSLDNVPDWIKIPEEISVSSDGQSEILLNFSPKNQEEKIYPVLLKAESLYGDEVFEKWVNVSLEDCYSYEIGLDEDRICTGDWEGSIIINNTGSMENEYRIELIGTEGIYPEHNLTAVYPGESESIPLLFNDDVNPDKYMLTLVSSIVDTGMEQKKTIELEILSDRDCIRPEILSARIWGNHSQDLQERGIEITNSGLKPAEYSLRQTNVSWIKINSDSLYLMPGEKGTIRCTVNASENVKQNDYLIYVLTEADGYVYQDTIIFSIWDYNFHTFISKYRCYVFIGIVGIVFFIFMGLAIKNRKDMKKALKNKVFMGVSLVLILVLILYCFSFFTEECSCLQPDQEELNQRTCEGKVPTGLCGSRRYLNWSQDTVYKLDLDDFFSDPENASLTYNASTLEWIETYISQGIVSFTPEAGWTGIENVTFTAIDANGAETESPVFYLHVFKKRNMGWGESLTLYHPYIIVILILLICIKVFEWYEMYVSLKRELPEIEQDKEEDNSDE